MASKKWKLPKFVYIGPHKIAVVADNTINEFGNFNYNELMIRIHPGAAIGVQMETLCHEIIEGVNIVYEMKLPHRTIQQLGAAIMHAAMSVEY